MSSSIYNYFYPDTKTIYLFEIPVWGTNENDKAQRKYQMHNYLFKSIEPKSGWLTKEVLKEELEEFNKAYPLAKLKTSRIEYVDSK